MSRTSCRHLLTCFCCRRRTFACCFRRRAFGSTGDVSGADLWRDLSHVDFVFLPDNMAHAVAPVHVTLALDLMGLERMTPDQADGHVRSVFEAGAPYFYSAMPTSTPPSAAGRAAGGWRATTGCTSCRFRSSTGEMR